jgi:hypothetical protein
VEQNDLKVNTDRKEEIKENISDLQTLEKMIEIGAHIE